MKIDTHKLAFAAASAATILHALFLALMVFAPQQIMDLVMTAHYIAPITPMHFQINLTNTIEGLLLHFVVTYGFVWLTAALYNACERKMAP